MKSRSEQLIGGSTIVFAAVAAMWSVQSRHVIRADQELFRLEGGYGNHHCSEQLSCYDINPPCSPQGLVTNYLSCYAPQNPPPNSDCEQGGTFGCGSGCPAGIPSTLVSQGC